MKRRLFLQGLLGASAITPAIAKSAVEPEFKHKEVTGGFVVSKEAITQIEDSVLLRSKTNGAFDKAIWPGIDKFYNEQYEKKK